MQEIQSKQSMRTVERPARLGQGANFRKGQQMNLVNYREIKAVAFQQLRTVL